MLYIRSLIGNNNTEVIFSSRRRQRLRLSAGSRALSAPTACTPNNYNSWVVVKGVEANGFLLPQQNPPTVTLLLQAIYPQKVSFYYNTVYSIVVGGSWNGYCACAPCFWRCPRWDAPSNSGGAGPIGLRLPNGFSVEELPSDPCPLAAHRPPSGLPASPPPSYHHARYSLSRPPTLSMPADGVICSIVL